MLPIIKYKIILFTITVFSLTICTLIICLSCLEIYANIREHIKRRYSTPYSTNKVIVFSMLCVTNIFTFANIIYMSIHALRGLRSTWHMGCNYFLYIVSEVISIVIICTTFDYLNYPVGLTFLVTTLAVFLFIITFAAERIFVELEYIDVTEAESRRYGKIRRRTRRQTEKRERCVTLSLYGTGVNSGAGSSKIAERPSDTSTIASVMSTARKK